MRFLLPIVSLCIQYTMNVYVCMNLRNITKHKKSKYIAYWLLSCVYANKYFVTWICGIRWGIFFSSSQSKHFIISSISVNVGCEGLGWIQLAQNRVHWLAHINMVMNLCVAWNVGKFLTSWVTISFSFIWTLIYELGSCLCTLVWCKTGQVVSSDTCDLYLGDAWFASQLGHQPSWQVFHSFPQLLKANARIVPEIMSQLFFSTYFPIHYPLSSNHLLLYSLTYWQCH